METNKVSDNIVEIVSRKQLNKSDIEIEIINTQLQIDNLNNRMNELKNYLDVMK